MIKSISIAKRLKDFKLYFKLLNYISKYVFSIKITKIQLK